MKTALEIEAELTQAAERLRAVRKAAKDMAIASTAEPVEPPTVDLGAPQVAPSPKIEPQR